MAKRKIATGSWDLIKNNQELKVALLFRKDEVGISYPQLEKELGVDWRRIQRFLNQKEIGSNVTYKSSNASTLTHYDILNLCDLLGVKINISVQFLEHIPLIDGETTS